MKKLLALVLAAMMLLSIAACAKDTTNTGAADTNDTTVSDTTENTTDKTDETTENTETTETTGEETTNKGEASAEGTDDSAAEDAAQPTVEYPTVRIAAMTGPTGMGMAKLLDENEKGTSPLKYEFTLATAADQITPLLVKGELDIAAVPVNLASVLYNNTQGEIQLLAVNTLGVIYILDNNGSVTQLSDLKGKTIYATGKGSTPEYTLRYLLTANGINPDTDVTIEWKSEPTEIVALYKNAEGKEVIAMMPQPYVTVAQSSVEGINVAISLTEEWEKLDNGSMAMTGCVVVRRGFAQQHPEAVALFLEQYEASINWVNENVEEAAQLIAHFEIVAKAPIAQKALPHCNITFIAGEDLSLAKGYLQALYDQNPKAVGGAMPGDDFYYNAQAAE